MKPQFFFSTTIALLLSGMLTAFTAEAQPPHRQPVTRITGHRDAQPHNAPSREAMPQHDNRRGDLPHFDKHKPLRHHNTRPERERRPHFDDRYASYDRYRYHRDFRPRHRRHDPFFDHYRRGWGRPVPPPMRPWRHSVWVYRPHIPAGFRPYVSAPIVDGVIGLYFGTHLTSSLDYLYYNGYYIDGYYGNIIYLCNVDLLGYTWPDAMLRYDDGLDYAQFSYYNHRNDSRRYNRLYRRLCASYGSPVSFVGGPYPQATWLGGDSMGYITLSMNHDGAGRYFTALSFGL